MRINYNASAAIANKHLLGIEDNLSTSMERLSSGLKINHAKDNPAGMAISNKMQAQIDALSRASDNASDGISVIQIADGALNEVTSIIQRMRELSVQAASDATMSQEDLEAIQSEIDSLLEEVDRVSTDTEYNTKTLLDGSLDRRVYGDNASRIQVSDAVLAGTYSLTIDEAATQAEITTSGVDYTSENAIGVSGTISINGSSVSIEETDTYAEIFEKIRNAAETGETVADLTDDGSIEFTSVAYGSSASVEITFDSEELATALGFSADTNGNDVIEDGDGGYVYGAKNTNGTISVPAGTHLTYSGLDGFSSSATVALDGNKITITDRGGVSMSFMVDADYTGELEFEVLDIGTMTLHIGANKDQNMDVCIPEVSCESLYIDGLDVTTVNGADRAIVKLDEALAQVSSVRSSLGAYQNRLEYAADSLDTFEENMTSAISRLTDVDMAEEMTNYTHQTVLDQAAISVLTQANDLPQQVLQILQ